MDSPDTSLPAHPAFLDRAPVRLSFGTSGLRGLVADITDLEAFVQVKGALRYLVDLGDIAPGSLVALGGDLRPSTPRIAAACAHAIVAAGCRVDHAGTVPTPALLAHAIGSGQASVMVTGSHIPFDRNGIKLGKSGGELRKSDEEPMTRMVERVRAEEYGRSESETAFDRGGMLRASVPLPPVDREVAARYVARYLGVFPTGALKGLRVLVYQHSAVGRDVLVHVLGELGAEVVAAGRSETFMPIDTEAIRDEQLARIEALVDEAEAAGPRIHAVVSTDGDSDRPLVISVRRPATAPFAGAPAAAVVASDGEPTAAATPRALADDDADEPPARLRFLPGDLLGLVVAEELGVDAVVVPVTSSDAVAMRLAERRVSVVSCRVGSPWVIAAMDDLRAAGQHQRIVGWEANGGFLTNSPLTLAGGVLPALPTRDAMLPILVNLAAAARHPEGLDGVWGALPRRRSRAGLIDEVPVAATRALMTTLVPPGAIIEVSLDEDDRVLDCTETRRAPRQVSRERDQTWRRVAAILEAVFTPEFGFGAVARINVVDGVRVRFDNDEVVHVRASGNAPQLRVYATCRTQARADRIVALAIAEPDGLLRRLLAAARS